MLVVGVAWWPGGRTRHRALRPLPSITASTADAQAPAAASATVNESGLTAVSPSSRPPPCAGPFGEKHLSRVVQLLHFLLGHRLIFAMGAQIGDAGFRQTGRDGAQAVGPFGMGAGFVAEEQRVGVEQSHLEIIPAPSARGCSAIPRLRSGLVKSDPRNLSVAG